MSDQGEGRRRVHFDPTVTLGHVLQAVVIIIPVFAWAMRVETKQAEYGRDLAAMQREMDRSEIVLNDKLRGLQGSLDRIEAKLDQKADKPTGGYRP